MYCSNVLFKICIEIKNQSGREYERINLEIFSLTSLDISFFMDEHMSEFGQP
jgi:hypothetical protein